MAEIYRARRRLQDVWWREAAGQYGDAVVHWDGVILTTDGEWLGQLPSVPVRPDNLESWLLSLEPKVWSHRRITMQFKFSSETALVVVINEQHTLLPQQEQVIEDYVTEYFGDVQQGIEFVKVPAAGWDIVKGTDEAEKRLRNVLTFDPMTGIIRHSDAGYERAINNAKKFGIKIPMLKSFRHFFANTN
jgi:hypothetical protein